MGIKEAFDEQARKFEEYKKKNPNYVPGFPQKINELLPLQLNDNRFRFCLIPKRNKAPFEQKWQNENNYSYDDDRLVKHIQNEGNYGVIGGYGNLIIIDFDDKDFQDKFLPLLPETFTVKTGSGGLHLYYYSDECISLKILDKDKNTLADIQGKGKQVVGAGSIHPNGNKYDVFKDLPISTIKFRTIKIIFSEYLKDKFKLEEDYDQDKLVKEIKYKLTLDGVLSYYRYDLSKNPTMCLLGHDSKGGKCFSYNNSNNLWYCHHCGEGGDIFNLVMQQEKCSFSDAKEILRKIAGIEKTNGFSSNPLPNTSNLTFEEVKAEVINFLLLKNTPRATEIIVDFILKREHIFTTRNDELSEVWIYLDGIYIPQGKTYIKEICRKILEVAYTPQLVNKVIEKVCVDTYIQQDEFFKSCDPKLLAVQNGILNLKTRELLNFTPNQIFFNKLPVRYVSKVKCEAIIDFFTDILPDKKDIDIIQELFGYLLYRDYKFEKAFMFLGSGRNGKGKTIELMKRFLGIENCSNISLQSLDKDNFAMGELFNKMANLSADLSKSVLEETGNFKSLTGHDLISAPRKFLTRVNFVNHAKMVFCANELPITKDITNAFFLRWILIDFPYTFLPEAEYNQLIKKDGYKIQDTEKIEKISKSDQLTGLLNWALDGFDRLLAQNGFSSSFTTEQVKTKWLRKSSSINAFIMDCVIEKWDSRVPKKEFRRAYNSYCTKFRLVPVSDRDIRDILSTQLGVSDDRLNDNSRTAVWVGINLNDNQLSYFNLSFEDTIIDNNITKSEKMERMERMDMVSDIARKTQIPILVEKPYPSSPSCRDLPNNTQNEQFLIKKAQIISYIKENPDVMIEVLLTTFSVTNDIIETLKRDGSIYESRAGRVRVV